MYVVLAKFQNHSLVHIGDNLVAAVRVSIEYVGAVIKRYEPGKTYYSPCNALEPRESLRAELKPENLVDITVVSHRDGPITQFKWFSEDARRTCLEAGVPGVE